MPQPHTPQPSVMPLDREKWKQELHLSHFVNTYYQYRDLTQCAGPRGKVLIIGPGAGLDALVLRWRGYEVTTFDIDDTFSPDVLGSCHHMPMFGDLQFDAVIASHVLEHLPLAYLDLALAEIARIGRFAILYLPVAGKHAQVRMIPMIRGRDLSIELDLFRFWEKPAGDRLHYGDGQHYWEIGYKGFKVQDVILRFQAHFKIMRHYRNKDWLPSYNFVLESGASQRDAS